MNTTGALKETVYQHILGCLAIDDGAVISKKCT